MTPKEILAKATWDKNTSYIEELTFVCPDGFKISAVRTGEHVSRKDCENMLIEAVQERFGE